MLVGEWWHPAYALAIAVALTSIVLHDGPWPRVLEGGALAWIGGLGYGIYLIHEPVMRVLGDSGLLPEARPGMWFLVTAVIVAVPSVLLAWLSSRTVERGRRADHGDHRPGRPAAGTTTRTCASRRVRAPDSRQVQGPWPSRARPRRSPGPYS